MTPEAGAFVWQQWHTVPTVWHAYVLIGGKGRCVAIHQHREQPEYWRFFRGDGNGELFCGPADLAGAKAFAANWLKNQGAVPA